jgi:hypothetical protein
VSLLKRFIAQTVCASCSRTGYRIVPLTNLNQYLHNETSETEVKEKTSANNGGEKFNKKKKLLLPVS